MRGEIPAKRYKPHESEEILCYTSLMPKLRKMLGAADSPYILSLMRLIDTQSKVTIAKWCMDYTEAQILPIFEKHCPGDNRPQKNVPRWKLLLGRLR